MAGCWRLGEQQKTLQKPLGKTFLACFGSLRTVSGEFKEVLGGAENAAGTFSGKVFWFIWAGSGRFVGVRGGRGAAENAKATFWEKVLGYVLAGSGRLMGVHGGFREQQKTLLKTFGKRF